MNSSPRDVVITGIGVISPIGDSVEALLRSVRRNESGIRLWQSPLLSKALPAATIEADFSGRFTKLELPYLDRCSQIAILAAQQAMRDGGVEQFSGYGTRAGLFYGSVVGGVRAKNEWLRQFHVNHVEVARPYTLMASMLNAAPSLISIRHGIFGPVMTNSSACSSSGAALGEAFRAIRDGYLDIAVAGGAESAIIPEFLALWGGLRALAPPDPVDVGRSCRPFSRDRSGLVIGEGAVFLLLESRSSAESRNVPSYGRLSGYGIASDGYHIGSPHARGQEASLRGALADAGLRPEQIGYINAHATATQGGDPVEVEAIRAAFGEAAGSIPVSSTKAIHGHLLGAASAIEFAISTLAVGASFLPATAHLHDIDPECELNHVAAVPVPGIPIEHALSFSAGFGGTNVALIVSRESQLPIRPLPEESAST